MWVGAFVVVMFVSFVSLTLGGNSHEQDEH